MGLFGLINVFAISILMRRPSAGEQPGPIKFEQLLAAAEAYATYLSAAMIGGAKFPEFLQNHLFDGLAPAAVVGVLIYFLTADQLTKPFDKVSRPYIVPLRFGLAASAVFGLIAAAAVFSSGASDYVKPALLGNWY